MMSATFGPRLWTCPHCNRPTTMTIDRMDSGEQQLDIGFTKEGVALHLNWDAKLCPNPECRKPTVSVGLDSGPRDLLGQKRKIFVHSVMLIPDSISKPQPDYIPQVVLDDYYEACKICYLSPKAAATLARRCLQGIIRDFWGIKKGSLFHEINEIKDRIDLQLWNAIDAVREVGNIGAHMQRDVNTIVDIDSDEARKLIDLVEILFEECYMARYERRQRIEQVTELGKKKKAEKSAIKDSK